MDVKKKKKKKAVAFVSSSLNRKVMAASIESLLEEISGVEDPIEELQMLKTALLSIPVSALRDSVTGQRFNVIFSLLNSNQRLVCTTHLVYTVSKLVGVNC